MCSSDLSNITYTLGANVENLTLTGTGNTWATGNAQANVLVGNAGNNSFYGQGGQDSMRGGLGNDFYSVTGDNEQVTELAGEGTDSVGLSDLMSYVLPDNVENFVSFVEGGTASGNQLNNLMAGWVANDNISGLEIGRAHV